MTAGRGEFLRQQQRAKEWGVLGNWLQVAVEFMERMPAGLSYWLSVGLEVEGYDPPLREIGNPGFPC